MNQDALEEVILQALRSVAPEAASFALREDDDLREVLDLDSMDVLRFARGLHERLGVDVPESDYGRIVTLRGCRDYLSPRLSAQRG